jgi:membrane protein involved in colicin uptake
MKYRLHEIEMYKLYEREVYNRENELFENQYDTWTELYEIAKKRVEDRASKKKADEIKRQKDKADAWTRAEAERKAREEEMRNDPFSDMNKDEGDPFADVVIERI